MNRSQSRIMGRTLLLTTILLQVVVPGGGQSQPRLTPVIELTNEEAAKAKALDEQLPQAQKSWDDLIWMIREKYTVIQDQTKYPYTIVVFPDGTKRGALGGFDPNQVRFSRDFRFCVGGGYGGFALSIIELTREDTAKARGSYEHLIQAQGDWAAFRESVSQKYTVVPKSDKVTPSSEIVVIGSGPNRRRVYRGLQSFRFSPDFRFIVGNS